MTKTAELTSFLNLISATASSASAKYGAHLFEHESGSYRACPESFVSSSVYAKLRAMRYRVSAEAIQGGIWALGGKGSNCPAGTEKCRYDLAVWPNRGNKPLSLIELKSGFNIGKLHDDASSLAAAAADIRIYPILCLFVLKPKKTDLLNVFAAVLEQLQSDHGIMAKSLSQARATKLYFCGTPADHSTVYSQALAVCLNTRANKSLKPKS